MAYNKEELFALSPHERVALAEELWSSVEGELEVTNNEIVLAEEKLKSHESNPNDIVTLEQSKNYCKEKYGF